MPDKINEEPIDLNELLSGGDTDTEDESVAHEDADFATEPAEGAEDAAADEQPGEAEEGTDAEKEQPAKDGQPNIPDIQTMIREAVVGVVKELGLKPAAAEDDDAEDDEEEAKLTPEQEDKANAAFLDLWTEKPLAALASVIRPEVERAIKQLVTPQIQPIQQHLQIERTQREFNNAVADLRAANPDFDSLVPTIREIITAKPFLASQGKDGLQTALELARAKQSAKAKAADVKRAAGLGTGGKPAQSSKKYTTEELIQMAIAGAGRKLRF